MKTETGRKKVERERDRERQRETERERELNNKVTMINLNTEKY
jgi:hypothetical protein